MLRTTIPVLLVSIFVSTARAEAPTHPEDEHEPVVVLALDLPILAASLGIWGFTDLFENRIGPIECRWCDTSSSLNAFDRLGREALSSAHRKYSATASDVLAYGFVPLAAFGLDLAAVLDGRRPHGGRRFLIDALLIAESMSTAMTFTALFKFTTARRRPDHLDEPVAPLVHRDEDLSFFSGHTTLVFSLATSAGTLASLRHERLAPLVWSVGIVAATATAMLRVAADRHYASDVLTASVVGSAVGVVVPVLHRLHSPVRVGASGWSKGGVLTIGGLLK